MTVQFIMWPLTIDVDFRADYLTETGEKIQDSPLESADDLSYMVGSDIATQTQLDALKVTHPDMTFNQDAAPTGWSPKIKTDIMGP